VKKAEVQLPDALYQQVEGLAGQLHTTVPELMRKAVEQLVFQQHKPHAKAPGQWQFPEARHLGQFGAPVEEWRLLANEDAA
jgi:predicted transcriptional regulator